MLSRSSSRRRATVIAARGASVTIAAPVTGGLLTNASAATLCASPAGRVRRPRDDLDEPPPAPPSHARQIAAPG